MDIQYIHLSDGMDIVFRHLNTVYGERGNLDYNLNRYFHSEQYRSNCRTPRNIEEILEVTEEDLHLLCKREAHFRRYSNDLIDQYDHLCQKGLDTTDYILELAGVFGICPGKVDWSETLFLHMVDLFVSSIEEEETIWKAVNEKKNYLEVATRLLCKSMRRNQILAYNGYTYVSIGYSRNFFRGENAYYGKSIPSMFRNETSENEDDEIKRLVCALKIAEFAVLIDRIPFVKQWPYGNIYHSLIAQHYGIPTSYIDFTSDIKTALFFACCVWDKEKKAWRKLLPVEYEKQDSRRNIYNMGGDARYGIIHTAPSDINTMLYNSEIKYPFSIVYPIGLQPFLRCHYQSGYFVKGFPDYDVFKDNTFLEVKFRLSEDICDWIFHEMEEGKKVYPFESIRGFENIINKINNTTVFSMNSFQTQMDLWKFEEDRKDDYLKRLKEYGYSIDKEFCIATQEEIQSIDNAFCSGKSNKDFDNLQVSLNPTFCL